MSDPEITNFAGAPWGRNLRGLATPREIREFEVECALEAAYAAGFDAGKAAAQAGQVLRDSNAGEVPYELRKLRERMQAKLELTKAVSQAICALSQIVDETGGIR